MMTKLDKLLDMHKGTTWTQELVDEYNLLKFEIESMEKENERFKDENRQLRFRLSDEMDCNQHGDCRQEIKKLKEQVQRELDDNNGLRKTVGIYLKIKREFEHGLPTSMKECAFICSKIYDLLENNK